MSTTVCSCHGMIFLDCPNRITAGIAGNAIKQHPSAEAELSRVRGLITNEEQLLLVLSKWANGTPHVRELVRFSDLRKLADKLKAYLLGEEE